jgi:hypothetical protein
MSQRRMLAGLGFQVGVRTGALFLGGKNAHLLPVISKFFAAIQTYDVRARLKRSLRASPIRFTSYGEADTFVPAAEQHIEYLHVFSLKSSNCSYINSECKPGFVSFVFAQIVSAFISVSLRAAGPMPPNRYRVKSK